MTITITLPDQLEAQLQREAAAQQRSVEEVALAILSEALDQERTGPTLEDVVAKIQALPPNPQNIRPARGSLADALRNTSEPSDFDLARWNEEWAAVEAEMKAITRANDRAEGRT
jgi:plasmid stability protein